jgi:hypothetical protein
MRRAQGSARVTGLAELRKSLDEYYASKRLADPKHKHSEIGRLTIEMLGPCPPDAPVLKAKASESRHLLDYVVQEFRRDAVKAATGETGAFILKAAEHMQEFFRVLHAHRGKTATEELANHLYGLYAKAFTCYVLAGGRGFYKHHAMYHLLQRMAMAGHPLEYWCYADEAFNRIVVTMARACHALAF